MAKVTQFHSKDEILEQASLWVSKIDRGLTTSEQLDLTAWVEESAAHYQALMKMASLWDDLTVLEELKCLFPLSKTKTASQPVSFWRAWPIAASIMFVSVLFAALVFEFGPSSIISNKSISFAQTYQTPLGQQQSFSLPDGSTLQLNTNSVVMVSYTEQKRFLELVKGEANFDVAKDKSRPFVVNVGDKSFTALGTVFNIQKNSEQAIELLVTEGKVLINELSLSPDNISQLYDDTPIAVNGVLVTSGEKAVIEDNKSKVVEKINADELGRDLAWRSGMLIFDNETLADALSEISRYNDTHFHIDSAELAQLKISGYFKAGDIEGLLLSLQYDFDVSIQRSGTGNKQITLSKLIQG
ncbi:FecR family protein [Thalassotalea sp. PLHSN55]|uniref:FecR family protein n=1 Tax=Thalassotalea sp. PLHSN55 TaxID=3435888 RepID=UPI003F830990